MHTRKLMIVISILTTGFFGCETEPITEITKMDPITEIKKMAPIESVTQMAPAGRSRGESGMCLAPMGCFHKRLFGGPTTGLKNVFLWRNINTCSRSGRTSARSRRGAGHARPASA